MSFKTILIMLLVLLVRQIGMACDACSMYEFSPLQAKSYFGLFYSYSFLNGYSSLDQNPRFSFNGNNLRTYDNAHIGHNHEAATILPHKKDYESYQKMDLRFNYNLKNKWNFLFNLPLAKNTIYYANVVQGDFMLKDSLSIHQGIGDILLAVDKISIIESNHLQHTFKYGLGLFLPTGNIDKTNSDPAHYVGRGGFEPIIRMAYSLKINQTWGTQCNAAFSTGTTFKTENIRYDFGSRFSAQTNLFYSFKTEKSGFIPMAGLYYESITEDKQNNLAVNSTGGKALFLNLSFGYSYKDYLIRTEWQKPLKQHIGNLQLYNAGRINIMIIRNI